MEKNIYELKVIENGIPVDFAKVKLNKEYEIKGLIKDENDEMIEISTKGIFKIEGNTKFFVETITSAKYGFVIKDAKKKKYKIKILYFIERCENMPDIDNIPEKEFIDKAKDNDLLRNYDFNCLLTLNPGMVKKGVEDGKKMICAAVLLEDTYCLTKKKKPKIITSSIDKVDTVNNCIYTKNSCYFWN